MNNVVNSKPYLRTTREIPEELHQLTVEVNKLYVDVAGAVNIRTIGVFPVNNPAITGDSYFFTTGNPSQTFREIYSFGAIAAGTTFIINHNIKIINQFTRIYGTCITSLPDYRPIPYASVAVNANIDLRVTSTQIFIAVGVGSPNITSGLIVLEWF